MANPYLVLWCDPNNNALYSGWNRPSPAKIPVVKQGDTLGVEVHWVRTGVGAGMTEVPFPPSAALTLAIGLIDTAPTSGSFTVTYGSDTTPNLAYNISATDLQTALNALTSITAEGGVTVTKINNQYKIVWNNVGTTANTLSANTDMLSPTSNGSAIVSRSGSATKSQIILLKLRQAPVAGTTSFTAVGQPTISTTLVSDKNWKVQFSTPPKSGTFRLSITVGSNTYTTSPIPFDAPAASVYDSIRSASALISGVSVVSFSDGSWEVNIENASSLTAAAAVTGFSAMYGTVSLNTAELEELISGNNAATAVFEVQADIDGEVQTLIQSNIAILNDLVDSSAFELVDLGQVIPAMAVVRYDTSQTLTSAEQLQARTNIGAGEQAGIDDLDTRVQTIEYDYVTSTELATKADLVHTHTASQISDSTTAGRDLLTAADAAAQRTALGLGTMAVEAAADYLTVSTASSTYLTQANAATTYLPLTESSKLPTADEKAALAGLVYSTTAPSAANKYLTESDFEANFYTEIVLITPSNGINHSASDVLATGTITSPDSAKSWLVTVAFNYSASDADLLSDVWWQDNNHELYFEEDGNITGGPQMTFARNSFQFVLQAGATGYELWTNANGVFTSKSGELYICYKAM